MDDSSRQDSGDELLTLTQALREAQGKVQYKQLWDGIRSGRVEAFQPTGPGGRYAIRRGELERITRPVRPPGIAE